MAAVKTDASFPGIPFAGGKDVPAEGDTDFDASEAIILRNSYREAHIQWCVAKRWGLNPILLWQVLVWN